ncbi:hypothetical protein [Roseomonas sp. AR75]|uniref:hypothetical protein n=1 Tax=Roseomonas sp. AR75 TaxID=2562311 RepID=UPI0010BF96E9|nr:hypothetical protein [Roseomonas sp. AR75]
MRGVTGQDGAEGRLAVMIPDPAAPAPPRQHARPSAAASPTQPPDVAPATPPTPNPSVRIDSALNLVVLEFRDSQGEVHTIPTARELDAYRTAPAEATPVLDVRR